MSKLERFYYDVGTALYMNEVRCFIDHETMKVEIYSREDNTLTLEEEDPTQIA